MSKPIFKSSKATEYSPPLRPNRGPHYHVADGKHTVAWSWSEERARARVVMNNLVAKKAGAKPSFHMYTCNVQDCYVLHGTE